MHLVCALAAYLSISMSYDVLVHFYCGGFRPCSSSRSKAPSRSSVGRPALGRDEEGVVDDCEVTEDQVEDNIEPDEEIENTDGCGLRGVSISPLEFIVASVHERLDVIVTLWQRI